MHKILFWSLIFIVAVRVLFMMWKLYDSRLHRDPNKVLEYVDIYLSDENVPDYLAVDALKKSLVYNPNNPKLIQKLNELEASVNHNVSTTSQTIIFALLSVVIGIMGISELWLWFKDQDNYYALILGIAFIIGSITLGRQFIKDYKDY